MVFDSLVVFLVIGFAVLGFWGLIGLFRRTGDLPPKTH